MESPADTWERKLATWAGSPADVPAPLNYILWVQKYAKQADAVTRSRVKEYICRLITQL